MTEKQKNFLSKFLCEESLSNVDTANTVIDFIIKTKEMKLSTSTQVENSDKVKAKLIKKVNSNREQYSSLDEYCSIRDICKVIGINERLILWEQKWYKGMSYAPSYNLFLTDANGNKLKSIYDLFVMRGIFGLQNLFNTILVGQISESKEVNTVKVKRVTTYIADDGKEFLSEEECKSHELKQRLKERVSEMFDLKEQNVDYDLRDVKVDDVVEFLLKNKESLVADFERARK